MSKWLGRLIAAGSLAVAYWPVIVAIVLVIIIAIVIGNVRACSRERDERRDKETIERLSDESNAGRKRAEHLGENTNAAVKRADETRKSDRHKGTTADELEKKGNEVYP